jgi:dGTPase
MDAQTDRSVAAPDAKHYDRLLRADRHRPSKVPGRNLEEEADSDRGRVLFSAPFRRLQNKAQVLSLETNAAVRSRLTHSLEVSSMGRYVAQQTVKVFTDEELQTLGIVGKERAFITFVETACFLHDLGNPPFGHFGETIISDWFHFNADALRPKVGGGALQLWERYYADFRHFDGNPQGLRISTRLQAPETGDPFGLNLTATTLAATLKYPWSSAWIGKYHQVPRVIPKKAGYFHTEADVITWIRTTLGLKEGVRHPLVFLMEAADDIAYCVSDIDDGIERGFITAKDFAEHMNNELQAGAFFKTEIDANNVGSADAQDIKQSLTLLKNPNFKRNGRSVERLTPMQDLRAGVMRFLARQAAVNFRLNHDDIIKGHARPLLGDGSAAILLKSLKNFASSSLYSCPGIGNREITAHAVLYGLMNAYLPVMQCDRARFKLLLEGLHRNDDSGRPIARDSSLVRGIARKYLVVYQEAVQRSEKEHTGKQGEVDVMERVHRIQLIIDHISAMTDEFALQSFQLISGVHVNLHRS